VRVTGLEGLGSFLFAQPGKISKKAIIIKQENNFWDVQNKPFWEKIILIILSTVIITLGVITKQQ
jgi:hypothetical protein